MTSGRKEQEQRRMEAPAMFEVGYSQADVARCLQVSRTTASRWWRQYAAKGLKGLQHRVSAGRPRRLDREIILTLWVRRGRPRITTNQMADLIEQKLGVHYDPDHVGRIMNDLGIPRRQGKSRGPK